MSEALPRGWALARLEDVISEGPRNGYSPKGGADAMGSATLKLSATTQGEMILDESTTKRVYETVDADSQLWLEPGDLLIQRANSLTYLGAAAIYDGKSHAYIYPDLMMRVRTTDSDLLQYLWRYLNSDRCRKYFQANATGTAGNMPKINSKTVKATPVLLPPLNEQRRIVAKIEDLTARSRAAKQALDAIPPLLERFRQSVLAAAFRGDLTKQWRQQNPNTEPASELLKRIRQERRQRWEQDYLQTQKAKGKQPKNDKWKAKYKEPESVDTAGLPDLPEGWCWAPLEAVSHRVTYGITVRPGYVNDGVPIISAKEIRSGQVDLTVAKQIAKADYDSLREKCRIFHDDVLFSKTGTIGSVARVTTTRPLCSSQNVAVISPIVSSAYLELFLRSPRLQKLAQSSVKTTAIPDLQLGLLSRFPVPVCPVAEQLALIPLVESLLNYAVDDVVKSGSERIGALAQSILAKAFRGELVPQDPNDEPASALLERIGAEREAAAPKKRTEERRRPDTRPLTL